MSTMHFTVDSFLTLVSLGTLVNVALQLATTRYYYHSTAILPCHLNRMLG